MQSSNPIIQQSAINNAQIAGNVNIHSLNQTVNLGYGPLPEQQFHNFATRLKKILCDDYEESAHVDLDLGDERNKVSVDELFVNLVIIEDLTRNLQKMKEALKQKPILPKNIEDIEEGHHQHGRHLGAVYSMGILNAIQTVGRTLYQREKTLQDGRDVIFAKKSGPIQLEKLFDNYDLTNQETIQDVKKILLLGRAGVGKSILCRYLAYCSSNTDKLPPEKRLWQTKFQWVFYFRLREIQKRPDLEKETQIHKILYALWLHKIPNLDEISCKHFWDQLLHSGQKILFLLDGYDEVAGKNHPACEALMSLCKEKNDHLHVLITSRPYVQIDSNVDIVLENIGLLDNQVDEYIRHYFAFYAEYKRKKGEVSVGQAVTLGDQLIGWLKQKPKIKQICQIPINLEFLCSIWVKDYQEIQAEKDFAASDIYKKIMIKLLRRYLQKHPVINNYTDLVKNNRNTLKEKEAQTVLTFLQTLAYHGLSKGELIIDNALFQNIREKATFSNIAEQSLLDAGFLNSIGAIGSPKTDFYFLHLSFQEYFIARYFAMQIIQDTIKNDSEDMKFFKANKFNPAYQLVWIYVAGIIKNYDGEYDYDTNGAPIDFTQKKIRALERYFTDFLLEKPRDLYGMYELELLIRCGEETKWPDYVPILNQLLGYLGQWVVSIASFPEKSDEKESMFKHLQQLFNDCPIAMANVHHKGQKHLFNILTYEAEHYIPWWSKFLHREIESFNRENQECSFCYLYVQCQYPVLYLTGYIQERNTNDFPSELGICHKLLYFIRALCLELITIILLTYFMAPILIATLLLLGTPILNAIYFYPRFLQEKDNLLIFLSTFRFEDASAATPLLALLSNSHSEACLRLLSPLSINNFSPDTQIIIHTLLRNNLIKENVLYSVKLISYQKLCNEFSEKLEHDNLIFLINASLFFLLNNPSRFSNMPRDVMLQLKGYYPEKIFMHFDALVKLGYPKGFLPSHITRHHAVLSLFCELAALKNFDNIKVKQLMLEHVIPLLTWQILSFHQEETQKKYINILNDQLLNADDNQLHDYTLVMIDEILSFTQATNLTIDNLKNCFAFILKQRQSVCHLLLTRNSKKSALLISILNLSQTEYMPPSEEAILERRDALLPNRSSNRQQFRVDQRQKSASFSSSNTFDLEAQSELDSSPHLKHETKDQKSSSNALKEKNNLSDSKQLEMDENFYSNFNTITTCIQNLKAFHDLEDTFEKLETTDKTQWYTIKLSEPEYDSLKPGVIYIYKNKSHKNKLLYSVKLLNGQNKIDLSLGGEKPSEHMLLLMEFLNKRMEKNIPVLDNEDSFKQFLLEEIEKDGYILTESDFFIPLLIAVKHIERLRNGLMIALPAIMAYGSIFACVWLITENARDMYYTLSGIAISEFVFFYLNTHRRYQHDWEEHENDDDLFFLANQRVLCHYVLFVLAILNTPTLFPVFILATIGTLFSEFLDYCIQLLGYLCFNNKKYLQKLLYNHDVFNKILHIISYSVIAIVCPLFFAFITSVRFSRMENPLCAIPVILENSLPIFHQERFFLTLLKHYPSYLYRLSQNVFSEALRKQFALHNTAVYQDAEGKFHWYQGRKEIVFECDNPRTLESDIQHIRRIPTFSGSINCFASCFAGKPNDEPPKYEPEKDMYDEAVAKSLKALDKYLITKR